LIETQSEVRYSLKQTGMGVQFVDMQPDHLALLEHFIEGKPLADVPPAPVVGPPPAPAANTQYMLTGNFAIVSLFDVIQIIENNRLTGAFTVTSAVANGDIYFSDGQIVNAMTGKVIGQDALLQFLDVTEGTFVFNKSDIEYPRTIEASSNMGLMLDLLRLKDEEAAFSSTE
jgi:hypothetical protein